MRAFFSEKNRSAGYARDRIKLLLVSERIDCSPQMMKLLRNDLIHAVKKYVVIDEKGGDDTDYSGTTCSACRHTCT